MRILIDTNIAVRLLQPDSPQFETTLSAVTRLPELGYQPCLVPQILYEFWVVVTRPIEQNGLGLSPEDATLESAQLASFFPCLRDERGIFERWQSLVANHDIRGKRAHDARLVAAIERHRISSLLTWNDRDFSQFETVGILTPENLI